jgi:two-component system chemotaxis response regulator CheB
MEVGAVACVEKPVARDDAGFEALVTSLLQTVRLMSEVKVVKRWARARATPSSAALALPAVAIGPRSSGIALIGIGTSTGGPPVLQTILGALPKEFRVPILIVQHIAQGFLPGLAEWLGETTGFQVHIAADGTSPMPGHVYLAPDDFQMGVTAHGEIHLAKDAPEAGLRPAVSYLFRSLAQRFGPRATGVLLTGMGKDGAVELKLMRDAGAVTIAQDRESSVVHGMPGEAVRLDAATHVLPADRIASALLTLTEER